MANKETSVWANGFIWFGAAVSIAEILTGTLIAPLGLKKGVLAILLGHFLGGILLYLAGLIGADTKKSAMETVKRTFGEYGGRFFAGLNVLQLIGWTAVMLVSGAQAAEALFPLGHLWIWIVLITGLMMLWISLGITNLGKINSVAMVALLLLSIVLSVTIFNQAKPMTLPPTLSFGAAVELSVAMPLSWLPLIADYTRYAKKKRASVAVSTLAYSLGSSWMFFIGLGMVLFSGQSDFSQILAHAKLGVLGLIIVIGSTVTTTFMDAYSAGVSVVSIYKHISEKLWALLACVLGMLLAIFAANQHYESFLYLIGSVFAPMIAIQIVSYFILKQDFSNESFVGLTSFCWLIGFICYRILLAQSTIFGITFPVMLFTGLFYWGLQKILGGKNDVSSSNK